jgi:hypothetical protein
MRPAADSMDASSTSRKSVTIGRMPLAAMRSYAPWPIPPQIKAVRYGGGQREPDDDADSPVDRTFVDLKLHDQLSFVEASLDGLHYKDEVSCEMDTSG